MKKLELIEIIKEELDLYDKIEKIEDIAIEADGMAMDVSLKIGDIWDELANLLDELDGTELEEITTTTGGFETPKAFKKKKKKIVKEEITSDDWNKLKKIIRMEIAMIYFDLYKKRAVWTK
jgi:hypothetical protein